MSKVASKKTAPLAVVVIGVSGSGKTTIGELLSQELGWQFYDADNYHPPQNREKLNAGIALNDEDRKPWLSILAELIRTEQKVGNSLVLACSGLKESYRAQLAEGGNVKFACLHGSKELIRERITARKGHFMNPGLLDSQFETFQRPVSDPSVIEADVAQSPEEIVALIVDRLSKDPSFQSKRT